MSQYSHPYTEPITTYKWSSNQPKGVVFIVHGMSEHAARYDHFAQYLSVHKYDVIACDLRGHGKTAGAIENVGFFAEKDGWNLVVEDVIELVTKVRATYPNLPLYLFGHSMGSFVVRTIMSRTPEIANGYVLSGTLGHQGLKGAVGKPVAKLFAFLFGKRSRSKFLMNMSFANYSKRINNPRTTHDWLSRDPMQVDKYLNDPLCSQYFTTQFFVDLATGVQLINDKKVFSKVSKELPVLLFAGTDDPIGAYGKGPKEVYSNFKIAGVEDVELKLFEGGRHETLNEINREEVYAYILDWLDRH